MYFGKLRFLKKVCKILIKIDKNQFDSSPVTIGGVPEGYEGVLLNDLVLLDQPILFVARDDRRMHSIKASFELFGDIKNVLEFPAWDCLPYDRVSPKKDIIASRIKTLTSLNENNNINPRIILTTISALLQRVPVLNFFNGSSITFGRGNEINREILINFLNRNSYDRSETVMEQGEYAIRGGILDLYPPGYNHPIRLDFFGDEIERIRSFDAYSQRTDVEIECFKLQPFREFLLDKGSIERFRNRYRSTFGQIKNDDIVYESVSRGINYSGIEHWLPLFFEKLDTLFDFIPNPIIVMDHQLDDAIDSRLRTIQDCFDARLDSNNQKDTMVSEAIYNPIPISELYIDRQEFEAKLCENKVIRIQPFETPSILPNSFNANGKPGFSFVDLRIESNESVYDTLNDNITQELNSKKKVVIGAISEGSASRLKSILHDHNIMVSESSESLLKLVITQLEKGFISPQVTLITEQDILGDRLNVKRGRKLDPENFIAQTSMLQPGDFIVHSDHGVGRFEELVTLDLSESGIPHDCLKLTYFGGDKLFLPVENIEIITRYGESENNVRLDKLGGVAWQAKKSALKERIKEVADKLIAVAAARELSQGEILQPPDGSYDQFCSGFSFSETDDQVTAINDVIHDMSSGRPMDRLICGDVGFGKTEIALRAAFIASMEGRQVAIVVPTTLLARQHYCTFKERFKSFPVNVRQLSRLVSVKDSEIVKEEVKSGKVDIVIGTHALLSKSIHFDRLGLLIIDEEQHFGVVHKERLKTMKSNVHILTLTATPIPRTLQLALTGVRDLSLITTPPVDRLAVRTFILPYDSVVVREAIQRELNRGGQIFYVCPRVSDLSHIEVELKKILPDLRITRAHGQMKPGKLDEIMTAFYEGSYDLLLATNIVESGLDIPSVNTIILHRADRFGLSQLYQLRGRIGRSKVRGYAYFTLPPRQKLGETALKRLEVMQSLDALGAGFALASHDLDIRGAGNLLGDEQSGHIKEVGVELYQRMLEEAVSESKSGEIIDGASQKKWAPQIDIGIPVLIPEEYVAELGIRLNLYRRIANLLDETEIEDFAAELVDRFGMFPLEVKNLLATVRIKRLCIAASVEKIDAGPKGAVVSFYKNEFNNLEGLVEFISSHLGTAKLRPDHKLVFMRQWDNHASRLDGVEYLLKALSKLAL